VLADHFQWAGNHERACGYYVQAADKASAALAFAHAARLYHRALELHAGPASQASRICRRLGDALSSSGRGAEAATFFLRAAEGATVAETLELRKLASSQLLISGRVDEGLSLLRTILGPLGLRMPPSPRHALLSLLYHRARVRVRGTRFQERDETQVSAEDLTRIDLCWSAVAGLSVIDPILGADFQTRGLLLALRVGEPFRVARALAMEAAHHATVGTRGARRAATLIEEAEALARRLDSPQVTGTIHMVRGVSALMLGQWRPALASFDQSGSLFRQHCAGVTWERDTVNNLALLALMIMGRIGELKLRWTALTREAQERGDLYAATTLAAFYLGMIRLADDDSSRVEDELAAAMAPWRRRGFLVQHFSAFRSFVHLDLYCGRVEQAWERLLAIWPEYTRSLLFRIQILRILMLELRARCALAMAEVGNESRPMLLAAEKDARALVREGQPWAIAHAWYLRAGIAACREDAALAVHRLSQTADEYSAADMELNAAVMRYKIGEIQGGDEGRALIGDAELQIKAESINSPARWSRMVAPGFSKIATCQLETSY
jgi:hypothetical protein